MNEEAPGWLLCAPRTEGMTDPDIVRAARKQHLESCFEELCDLYVALTRAKYGMYVYLPPLTKAKRSLFHPDWPGDRPFAGRRPFASADAAYYITDFLFESCFCASDDFSAQRPLDVATLDDRPDAAALAALSSDDGADEADDEAGTPAKDVKFIRFKYGELAMPAAPTPRKPVAPLEVEFSPGEPRPRRSTPSTVDEERKLFFTLPQSGRGAVFGTSVHAFFEAVERFDDSVAAPPESERELREHYDACRERGEVAALLNSDWDELWRERPFDVMIDDPDGGARLISGCFDRVQIFRDDRGAVTRACIIDYKSNRIEEADVPEKVKRYSGQLETYRKALSKLLGITPNIIDCRLVFTCIGVVAAVEHRDERA